MDEAEEERLVRDHPQYTHTHTHNHPPPPRLEAGAAANQASLAAPSAGVYRGQMEARPHMLPHIRWQLEEGGWGVTGRYTCPLLLAQLPPRYKMPLSTDVAPECFITLILLATTSVQRISDIRCNLFPRQALVREVHSWPKEESWTCRGPRGCLSDKSM